jgi:MoaA/NifB/PqqE/SkfB family radical SAM enzyme
VTVSVDSHISGVYSKIRGVDALPAVLGNLKALLSERPAHLGIDTNTVLCRDNAETFLATLDFLVDLGITKVNFSAITTFGANYLMTESKAGLAEIEPERVDEIVEGLLERKKRTGAVAASSQFIWGLTSYYRNPSKLVYPCFAGFLTLDIFQDGSVHGCGNLPSFANVRDRPLRKIWFGEEAQKNRINMAEGRCPNCYVSCKVELAVAANPKYLPFFAADKLRSLV